MSLTLENDPMNQQAPATEMTKKGIRLRGPALVVAVALVALCLAAFVLFGAPVVGRIYVGVAGLVLFLALLLLGLPVGMAMGIAGAIGIYGVGNFAMLRRSLIDLPYSSTASWSLSVIPMFIFMGLLLWRSGATDRVFDAARTWLNWLPGGHAVTVNIAGAGLAAASGSTLGIAYALGRIGLPEMLRGGYSKRLALTSVLLAGLPGQLIPPSLLMVVYAGVTNLPVGPQLLAGVVPGLLLVAVVIGTFIVLSMIFPDIAPRHEESAGWRERRRTLARVWPVPLLVLVVIGGMYSGLFTATEAAAVGVIIALAIMMIFCTGRERWNALRLSIYNSVNSVGSLFLIIVGSAILNRFLAISGIPTAVASFVQAADLGQIGLLLGIILVMFLLGLFMESISMLLISVPMFLPAMIALDVNLLWFGVVAILVAETAVLTPPVGILTYLVHGLTTDPEVNGGRKVSLGEVFASAILALPLIAVVVLLLFLFPEIATWLPATAVRGP